MTLVGHPFDTLKVRLQTQPVDKPIYCECGGMRGRWAKWRGVSTRDSRAAGDFSFTHAGKPDAAAQWYQTCATRVAGAGEHAFCMNTRLRRQRRAA